MRSKLIILILIAVCGFSAFADIPASYKEGGFYGNEAFMRDIVNNFVSNFTYEMLEWTIAEDWTTANNSSPYGVDFYDFVYFCGHGAGWYTTVMNDGAYLNLQTAGNTSHAGYGNSYMEYLVLHSCAVLASPVDLTDPWTPLLNEPGGIFDGLHVLCGFRTNAAIATAYGIATYFGQLTAAHNDTIVNNWINAVNTYGANDGRDKYCVFAAFRDGYLDNPTYDAWYDIYSVQECYDTVDPNLWCVWEN